MMMTLSRGLSFAALLGFHHRSVLAVMSTEVVNNFAVELDFSSITELVDESRSGEVVVAADDGAKQKAVVDGSSRLVKCRWGCNYCCCC